MDQEGSGLPMKAGASMLAQDTGSSQASFSVTMAPTLRTKNCRF